MISINRLEEMAIEELETKLNNWKEQVELQSNFIDSLLKATNNSEWLNKTILDDEASEIIEKIELDYIQLDQLKAENDKLKEELNKKYIREDIKTYCPFFFRDTATCLGRDLNEIGQLKFCNKYHNCWIKKVSRENLKLKQTLTEIKEIAENGCYDDCGMPLDELSIILQKISECEGNDEKH